MGHTHDPLCNVAPSLHFGWEMAIVVLLWSVDTLKLSLCVKPLCVITALCAMCVCALYMCLRMCVCALYVLVNVCVCVPYMCLCAVCMCVCAEYVCPKCVCVLVCTRACMYECVCVPYMCLCVCVPYVCVYYAEYVCPICVCVPYMCVWLCVRVLVCMNVCVCVGTGRLLDRRAYPSSASDTVPSAANQDPGKVFLFPELSVALPKQSPVTSALSTSQPLVVPSPPASRRSIGSRTVCVCV